MIQQQAYQMSSQYSSMISSLASLSVEDKLWHLNNNMNIEANEDNLESLVHKLESLKFDQIMTIYTITITPPAAMAAGLREQSEEGLRCYYKQMAKDLHPDKCVHPKAKEAFQKMKMVVDDLVRRF